MIAVPVVSYFALGLLGASLITMAAVFTTQAFGGALGGVLAAARADFGDEKPQPLIEENEAQLQAYKGVNPNHTLVGKFSPHTYTTSRSNDERPTIEIMHHPIDNFHDYERVDASIDTSEQYNEALKKLSSGQ